MVYGIYGNETVTMQTKIKEALELKSITITKSNQTPGGYGDLSVSYSTNNDSGRFVLASTPHNCNLIWMGGVSARLKGGKCLKFEVLELMCKYFGHTGIFLSQTERSDDDSRWEVYEKYGFHCIMQDRGIQHGNNNDMRIYYKPLNDKIKAARGGKGWAIPLGFLEPKSLRKYSEGG